MENKTKLSIGVIITLILAISGTYYVADGDTTYYCEDKDMVMICEKLSSGLGTRCYYEDTYKICSEGWNKIDIGQKIILSDTPISTDGTKWKCSTENCIIIE